MPHPVILKLRESPSLSSASTIHIAIRNNIVQPSSINVLVCDIPERVSKKERSEYVSDFFCYVSLRVSGIQAVVLKEERVPKGGRSGFFICLLAKVGRRLRVEGGDCFVLLSVRGCTLSMLR